MKQLEKILLISIVVAILMKLLNIPGNGILFVTTSMFISVFYLLGSWYFLGVPYNNVRMLLFSIYTGMAYSLAFIAVLYRIQHWENYILLFYLTLIAISIALLILFFIRKQLHTGIVKMLIIRSVAFVVFNIVSFYI